MKLLASAAIAAACLMSTPAAAQSITNYYAGIGLTHIDADVEGLEDAGKLGFEGVTGRLGAQFNQYFSVEGEATFGWEDATTHVTDPAGGPDIPVSVELKNDLSLYAVGHLPMTDNADLFVKAGYGRTKASAEVGDERASDSSNGFRWGVGAQFYFTDADGIRIDFSRIDTEEVNSDAYTISYVRKFGVR